MGRIRASAAADRDEQVLVRRVVTAICGVAVLTVPLIDVAFETNEGWVAGARLAVLAAGFGLLGRTRLRTSEVVGGMALVMWVVTLVSVSATAAAAVAGPDGTEGAVGLGTGMLWLAAGIGPALFLALPLRRAGVLSVGALLGFVLMAVLAAGGDAAALAAHPGVVQVVVATVVVLGITATVAWLARRSAEERATALRLREERAAVTQRLAASRRRRERLFSRTAVQLQAPMTRLSSAVDPLRGNPDAHVGTVTVERAHQLSRELLEEVLRQMDRLVAQAREGAAEHDAEAPIAPPVDEPSDAATTILMTLGVCAVVAWDAWRVTILAASAALDPHVVAAAASRMLLVLFVAAAVLAVRFPGPFGWVLTGLALLAHPVALLGLVDAAPRAVLLPTFAGSWRIAVLASGMLALLAAVIARRVRDRDAFVAEADDDEARSLELRERERVAELAYAEATHELKNPLAVIQGSAQVLAVHGDELDPERTSKLRHALVQGVDRLAVRLAVMRDVANAGPQPVQSTPAPPAAATDVLLEAVQVARLALEDHAIDVDVRVTGEWTTAPPGAVEHILENLLGNAHKYGEPTSPIRLTARRDGDELLVEVANRGGRLTPADAERMFDPYWRAADVEDGVQGTGIGLALVARLVQGWDGRCWAEVGDGWTRVGFTLPLAGSDQTATWRELEDQLDGS